ncbi:MAG: sulfite exporter TauE/SafE family protein [Lutibacter sp.]|nr:sulfite exporter TauE/SafE family protein [Lutibacter sp.]MBP9600906.1 sulfite exporter TauE/SafE family protein [Lutibacter sp.]
MNIWLLALIILAIASIMIMSGRGGGNFYVLALAFSGFSMHEAATTGQFILVLSSLFATIFFGKNKVISWKLVFLIGSMTIVSAFLGGFLSDIFNDKLLKIVFAVFISIAALLMLKPLRKEVKQEGRFILKLHSNNETYFLNLFYIVPIVLFTGFVSGMVGISGGSFLVPLMVLLIRVPMKIAVGTSTTLVMFTALSGFLGHLSSGHFDIKLAIPLAIGGIIGAIIGTKFTLKTKPEFLKIIFASTSLIAALIMIYNVLQ